MDYNEFEKSIYDYYKEEIINRFKKVKNEGKPFTKATDRITRYISTIRNNSIIYKNLTLLHDCIYDINHRLDEYESPELALNSIISNEIKDSFYKVSDRIIGLNNEKLNISYDDFIKELITYDCLGRIEQRVKNNSELYNIFYENNDYKDFTLEHFENHVVNSDLYKKSFKKFYPGKPIKTAIKETNIFGFTEYKIKILDENSLDEKNTQDRDVVIPSRILLKYKNLVKHLTVDEKLLLLHICITEKYNLDDTEKIKLMLLASGIDDFRIFEQKSNVNLVYNKINKGLNHNYNHVRKEKLVESIKSKIEICNLTKTVEILDSLLYNNYKNNKKAT